MSLFDLPPVEAVADHFVRALAQSRRDDYPYRHWKLEDTLPEIVAFNIIALPIIPMYCGNCDGTRIQDNSKRTFLDPGTQARYPVLGLLAKAMQSQKVTRQIEKICETDLTDSYLRIEYIQDTDGAWLEPHPDIKEKIFSAVLYLFTGPDKSDWGTDIYDRDTRWVGRATGEFNSCVIFLPTPHTWHGYDKRPIAGIRRLMELNYVRGDWRDRNQLAFPQAPINRS